MSAPSRSSDTGALALCGLLVVWVAAAAALPAGQGAASSMVGGGWVWPAQERLLPAIGGLLSGEPGRGLTPADQAAMASAGAVYTAIVLLELALVALMVVAAVLAFRMRGHRGMATRTQARQEFGAGALRRRRAQIRPDLYGKARRARG